MQVKPEQRLLGMMFGDSRTSRTLEKLANFISFGHTSLPKHEVGDGWWLRFTERPYCWLMKKSEDLKIRAYARGHTVLPVRDSHKTFATTILEELDSDDQN